MDKLTDRELIDRYCNNNDKKAFAEIYTRHKSAVYRFIYARTGNAEMAQDILSETFVLLMDLAAKYDDSAKLSTFIIGIALNKVRQHWDRIKVLKEYGFDDQTEDVSEITEDNEYISRSESLLQLLPRILEQLEGNYKDVLLARFIDNKSIKQTADELNLSPTNVTTLTTRAIEKATIIANNLLIN